MNCRFCGNFVPDGADSCPVCGRRQEEDPIGKLLSENRPGMDSEEDEANKAANSKKKNLAAPIIAIIAGIAMWVYGYISGALENMRMLLFEGIDNAQLDNTQYIMIGLVILGTIIAIIGIVTLFSAITHNSEKSNKK